VSDPIIRIKDIAWIRLRSPDLDKQEAFLRDFGMTLSDRTSNALYMRGTDPDHHIHITEKGAPGVTSIAFHARTAEDLYRLSREADNCSEVEAIDEPGGGQRVRLQAPSGMGIEVVFGVETVAEEVVDPLVLNTGHNKHARNGELLRVSKAPSKVKRIGHSVISTPDIERSVLWAHKHLGIVRSDDVHAEDDPTEIVGSFNRVDDGDAYVDHHVLLFVRSQVPGLNHVAFEVQDFDDLLTGHEHLKERHDDLHVWGVGRHTLGSQIFDYWKDPWGRLHEHWTDSDMLNKDHQFQSHPRSSGFKSQWGTQSPQEFRGASSPLSKEEF